MRNLNERTPAVLPSDRAHSEQTIAQALFTLEEFSGTSGAKPVTTPDLASYDVVLVNTSAGKDSQAALDVVASAAADAGVLERVVAVHADLGDAEWPGTRELAAEHAAHYGLRFETVARQKADGAVETILERVLDDRGMWPDSARRWCTSDHKRGPVRKLMTRLVTECREAGVVDRPVRLLNVMGLNSRER